MISCLQGCAPRNLDFYAVWTMLLWKQCETFLAWCLLWAGIGRTLGHETHFSGVGMDATKVLNASDTECAKHSWYATNCLVSFVYLVLGKAK